MSGIRLGICVTVLAAALGLAGCQEEKPVVKLDDALRSTAQFRLGQEMTETPRQTQPGQPAANFWEGAEGGQTEIDTTDLPEGSPVARARALFQRVARDQRRIPPQQRIIEFERVLALIGNNRSQPALTLRREAHYRLAVTHNIVGDFRRAVAEGQEAVRLFEVTRVLNDRYLAVLQYTGIYAATIRDFATAEVMLQKARAQLAQNTGGRDAARRLPVNRARVAALEAWLVFTKGEHAASAELFSVAVSGFEEAIALWTNEPGVENPRGDLAATYSRRSRVLLTLGRVAEAETSLLDAIRLFTELDGRNSTSVADHLRQLGHVLGRQGRNEEQDKVTSDAIDILERMGRNDASPDLAFARIARAAGLVPLRRDQEALQLFDKGYATLRQHAPQRLFNDFQDNYLMLLARFGRQEEALQLSAELIEFRTRQMGPNSFPVANARTYRANILSAAGDTAASLAEYRAVLPVIFGADDDLAVDEEFGTTGRESLRRSHAMNFLALAARVMAQDPSQREAITHEAFAIAERARSGSTARALASAAERLAIRDPAVAGLVRRDQNAGLEHSRLLRRIAELSRARLEDAERAELATARQRVAELETARRTLKAAIAQRDPQLVARTSQAVPSLDETRAALADDEAMITLYVAPLKTYIWAFRRTGPVSFAEADLPSGRVSGMVTALRKPFDTPVIELRDIPAYDVGVAHGLYRELLLPVRQGWEGAGTLAVVAHGPLSQIPFHLLVTAPTPIGADERVLFDRYAKVPFLAKTIAVSQIPSAASLVQLRAQKQGIAPRDAFVGFGDALFNQRQAAQAQAEAARPAAVTQRGVGRIAMRSVRSTEIGQPVETLETRSRLLGGLARLPETAEELRAVAQSLGADPAKDVFLGIEANEARVRSMDLSNKRVIMFATHGLLAGDLPGLTQPALALTSPEVAKVDGDGLLTLDNIMGLRLNADWVVLSACNTAGGDGANAEAISGLGRAFFYAGTRALLVTNWAVETVSAQALTTALFREQRTGASRGEALRRTMVGMIERGAYLNPNGQAVFSYAHPLFWAPYSLVGDPASSRPGS